MVEFRRPTALVRLTQTEWSDVKEAIQYYDALPGVNVTPSLIAKFAGHKFEPSPQLLGQAADLIDLFVACRQVPGPVHVAITGPQGSGKTVLTAAITHALRLVEVPVHVEGSDPFDDQTPTFVLRDGSSPNLTLRGGRRIGYDSEGFIAVLPDPPFKRIRRSLGRLVGRITEALSR